MTEGAASRGLVARERAAVIYNPAKVDLARLRAAVLAREIEVGWCSSIWLETTEADPGQRLARAALGAGASRVIVAGGDGTVGAVAEVLSESGVVLAIVPSGTGNLLARNLGLPVGDVNLAVAVAFAASRRKIDVAHALLTRPGGSVETRTFLVMAGIGLDARMASSTNAALKKRLGWLAYTHPIARSVLGNRQFVMRYRVGESRTGSVRAHTVIVGNCGTLTAKILLLPDAAVDDGLLDVVVLRPKGIGGWARIGSRLGAGGFLKRSRAGRAVLRSTPDLRALQYLQAPRFSARFAVPQELEFDGDTAGTVVGADLWVTRRALTICVPGPEPS